MKDLVIPNVFGASVTAFFTGRRYGTDPADIARLLKRSETLIYMPIQKHTDKVFVLEAGMGPVIADAVVTKRKDVLIGVQVADCVPILLSYRGGGPVAAVHAGWRGTASGILINTIRKMSDRFGVDPSGLSVAIGPSIGGCCYCVGHDVFSAVVNATGQGDYHKEKAGQYFLDLKAANKHQAISAGVSEDRIWISDDCTSCKPERYYSYRLSKGPAGRQGGFIGAFLPPEMIRNY